MTLEEFVKLAPKMREGGIRDVKLSPDGHVLSCSLWPNSEAPQANADPFVDPHGYAVEANDREKSAELERQEYERILFSAS